MLDLPEYEILETISETATTRVYRGRQRSTGEPVVLKTQPAAPEFGANLQHEFALLSELDSPGVVRVRELLRHPSDIILVEEDIGGVALRQRIVGGPCSLEEFWPIAQTLAEALEQVHQRHIVHRDINPRNIVWNRTTGRVQLIDFGHASRLSREQAAPAPPDRIEGSLPYLAPEQTGRMNRMVDYRADFYALGITFNELLTGQHPFTAEDALEWVHCHIARAPRAPREVVPSIPAPLSDLVLKLLAKLAEDRYQSAAGLRADLERCQREWEQKGEITPFSLGSADVSDRFQLPQKLYGREAEVSTLLAAFDRVARSGSAEMMLVAGYSGVGKSVLVAELHKPIVARRGYFLSGKFDQFQRDIPYAAITAAFHELIRQLLAESDVRIGRWRQRLLEALGENGRLIADLMPQVELIIGPQPAVEELPPDQAQHRLHLVFQRFVAVFTTEEHPVVLFLDDLQWIDAGSLRLLERLVAGAQPQHLLLLGAYRDNEVGPGHPLVAALEGLRKTKDELETITLAPLTESHVREILADILGKTPQQIAPLGSLVFSKTRGNPFFTFQFLTTLHHDGLLAFDATSRRWRWDLDAIRARNFTDNVVSLMLGELQRLPAETSSALAVAGFLGNEFALDKLALVLDRPAEVLSEALWPALRSGLLARHGRRCRFLHDRVQEAAYALLPEDQRPERHAHIGRVLCSHATPVELEEDLFNVVGHLQRGAAFIFDPAERRHAAELFQRAGLRAQDSASYGEAARYFAVGVDFLPAGAWETEYALCFELHRRRAECEYLTGKLEAAHLTADRAIEGARSATDRAMVALTKSLLHMAGGNILAASETAFSSLRELGVSIPGEFDDEYLWQVCAESQRLLGDRSLERLIALPPMTNSTMIVAMRVLAATSAISYYRSIKHSAVHQAAMINLVVTHGQTDAAASAYAHFGTIESTLLGQHRSGYALCELAHRMVDRLGQRRFRAVILLMQGVVAIWAAPVKALVEVLREAVREGVDSGDLHSAGFAAAHLAFEAMTKASNLSEGEAEVQRHLEFLQQARFTDLVDMLIAVRQAARSLLGRTRAPGVLDDTEVDWKIHEARVTTGRAPVVPGIVFTFELLALSYAGRFAEAMAVVEKIQPWEFGMAGLSPLFDYHLHAALTRAAVHPTLDAAAQPGNFAELCRSRDRIGEWTQSNPDIFASAHALVSAEIARVEGHKAEAMQWYQRAIDAACTHGLLPHEALAQEFAGRFYEACGIIKPAEGSFAAARDLYLRWGAAGKVQQLERMYSALRRPVQSALTSTGSRTDVVLDTLAIVKATQAISGHILREDLLRALLGVVLEDSGAQFGSLLLVAEETLRLVATAEVRQQSVTVQLPDPSEPTKQMLPLSLLQYVRRSREVVLLEDARQTHAFHADVYLQTRRPCSVLGLPILRQRGLVGVLYLEHRTATHVFTIQRLALLEQLAAQAAISLENAQMYEYSVETTATLRLQSERLQLLHAIDRAILAATSLEDICTTVLEPVSRLIPARRVSIALYDEKGGEAVRFVIWQGGSVEPPERVPLRNDLPHPLTSDQVAVIENIGELVGQHPILAPLYDAGLMSVLTVPLVINGALLGRFNFFAEQPDTFTKEHRQIAVEVAAQLSIAAEQHRLHEQIQQHARELEQRVAERTTELASANQELEAFAYSVSHDLRAPLRFITKFSSVVVADYPHLDPQARIHCANIQQQSMRMSQLIDDLLAFSRWSRAPLRRQAFSMTELVRNIFAELGAAEDRPRIDFHLDPLPDVPGDPNLVRQVWSNLISNAIKYSSKKARALIQVTGEAADGQAIYHIRDNGAGFDMRYVDKLFGVFRRLHREVDFPGTGVGLAIVRRIVERHGGQIWAEAKPEEGATFSFSLPKAPPIA